MIFSIFIRSVISPLSRLEKLKILDISENKIVSPHSFSSLSKLEYLMNLVVRGNPMCSYINYAGTIFKVLPKLALVDDRCVLVSYISMKTNSSTYGYVAAERI